MLRRLIFIFTLALLFGLGQQGAVVHEISHYADLSPLSQQQDKSSHTSVCDKCVVYGELASALGVAYFAPVLLAGTFDTTQYHAGTQHNSPLYAYSARAPPVLA